MKVLALFGPTASGKTEILSRLFTGKKAVRAEVVSADSMQVYRGMDIGTAKPDAALRAILPHHLIDIRGPSEPFNAGDFVRLADSACLDIAGRGALPVVAGGTGFYLKNFICGLSEAPPSDPAVREQIKRELAQKGQRALMDELSRLDPQAASRIHLNDVYRLTRALEVCRASGRPLSSFAPPGQADPGQSGSGQAGSGQAGRPEYDFLIIELYRPREELYRRVDARTRSMFAAGLPAEVERLFGQGYTPADPGLRAIGYREFFVEEPNSAPPWRLSADLAGVRELVARNSRRYAKRQMTFFTGIPGRVRLDADKALDLLPGLLHTFLNQNP